MRAALLAVIAGIGLACPSWAFVVETAGDPAGSPVLDLAHVARWDANDTALTQTGERGLGGGLEYAVDSSVCERLNFVDGADCAQVRAQISAAINRWAVGHPSLFFTDVTGRIEPQLAPAAEGWRGHGAEIDFFASAGSVIGAEHDDEVAADTRSYFMFDPAPRDPEGRVLVDARGRLTAADVRFNADMCFFLDPEFDAPGCVHFGSVVMHEIAHTLGLGHPDENPTRNLDLNDDPGDAMAINCIAPSTGLHTTRRTERYAVANGRWTGSGYWTRGLTYDDLAGRDALYPSCTIAPVVAASGGARQWAAFAISADDTGGDDAFGWARALDTQTAARLRATSECSKFAGSCRVAAVFSDCFAFARNPTGAWGWAVRDAISDARSSAVANCSRHGASCEAPIAYCASDENLSG